MDELVTPLSLADARRLGREWLAVDGVPRPMVPIIAALTAPEPPSYPGLRLDEYAAQAQAWLDAHLPHDLTEAECVPCQMATNLVLVCNAWFEAEGWRIDEQMQRAGGAPDDRELLGEAFDAENGAGASEELLRLAAENTDQQGLPECPFCGGELCAVVLSEDVGGGPGVSCGGCGAYTSRLPWREPWLHEGHRS